MHAPCACACASLQRCNQLVSQHKQLPVLRHVYLLQQQTPVVLSGGRCVAVHGALSTVMPSGCTCVVVDDRNAACLPDFCCAELRCRAA